MAKIITTTSLSPPLEINNISQSSFVEYLSWDQNKKEVRKILINPFEEKIKQLTGFNDENIPSNVESVTLDVGQYPIEVTITPTTKRPQYQVVVQEFSNYINFLIEQKDEGIRRKYVRTYNDEDYVANQIILDKLNNLVDESKAGKQGVSYKINIPEIATENELSVSLNRNYASLTESNLLAYATALDIIKKGDSATKPFKGLLLEDSLAMFEEPQRIMQVEYPYQNIRFIHQIEQRTTIKHQKVVESFNKPEGKRITKASNIGDLVLVNLMRTAETKTTLTEKGLLGCMTDYILVVREGESFIRLQGVSRRLEQYKTNNSNQSLEQNLYIKP